MPNPAVRLTGFLVLLAVVFAGAHAAGARFGPVTTGHSLVRYDGGGGGSPGMGGMRMGGMHWGGLGPRHFAGAPFAHRAFFAPRFGRFASNA